jgi:hypothetical protein
MAEFDSLDSYQHFQLSVRRKRRFVHSDQTREFLDTVIETSRSRVRRLKTGSILFRAQRGSRWTTELTGEDGEEVDVEVAFSPDRMVPKAESVGDGRVNPSRIPCLYLANNKNTAMAEVRPWIGSRVSLAQFKVIRDCHIVDCSLDTEQSIYLHVIDIENPIDTPEPDAATKEAGVWGDINHALSEPMNSDDPYSDYIPTQVISEAFKNHGYDGIVYKSSLDEKGRNIALFDVAAAELINCGLYETKAVSFEFEHTDNPYFVMKHYPDASKSGADSSEPPGAS